jgi:hypothetical protein
MTNVKNLRKDRRVDVRGVDEHGQSKVYRIEVGQTVNVLGFDAKRPFNKELLEADEIRVGGGGKASSESDDRAAELAADLETAQTAFKQAKDILTAANKALKEEGGDTSENKKAKSLAVEAYKAAEKDLEDAEVAYKKG